MAYNQKYHISYQLGAYYDMRYMKYITRSKFILDLSDYNEDDTVYEWEEIYKELFIDNDWNILLNWEIQEWERRRREKGYSMQIVL